MKAKKIRYNRSTPQHLFHQSIKPNAYMSGGYGSGKTYALVMKCLKLRSINYGLPGGLVCPTLKMFKRDVLPTFKDIFWKNRIPYRYHKTDCVFTLPNTKSELYIFHGEDDGESIRGPNLADMGYNEVTLMSKATFEAGLARVRLKQAKLRQNYMGGTPEGFGWYYEYFIENPREDTDLIYAKTSDNTHIAEDYEQRLRESYDEEMVRAFVEGEFVNLLGGRAIRAFSRRKHIDDTIEYNPSVRQWVTIDFNVDPMSAVIWNRNSVDSDTPLEAYDEIYLPNSDTDELAEELKRRIPSWQDAVLYPDPAGGARSTKSRGKSDISILKSHGFTNVKYKKKIPSVRDGINALNKLYINDKMKVHPRCKNFITDLERCVYKGNTFELDKSDSKRTHWLDGAKNMADLEFPIKAGRGTWSRKIR